MQNGSHNGADMCDDINHCQAFKTKEYAFSCWSDNEESEKWNKIKTAVLETQNEVITYDGCLINAFFHAHSGGTTENVKNIWGHEEKPYLISVSGNEKDEKIEEKMFKMEEINEILSNKYDDYENIESAENKVKILEINSSGRVAKMQISNLILEGTEVRTLFNLRSTKIDVKQDSEYIKFITRGYGHGVGMSQEGANGMAINGYNYMEIIKHYYTGVEIEKME